ncbi:potassium transporter TrkG [Anianabacter salinae]|uniref:potassium transporter TrkG n=1 Tax=Anianabacter salinae TaxID=2851023 RepID=UPI00225E3351|nr:potassium transporter TrkG [Anianabacter salinae]MBV0911195.1 TrkH family potassium uptake protein [Anianabacter salinae]
MRGLNAETALRARPRVVALALSQQALVLLAVVVPPALAALVMQERALALAFAPQIAVLVLIAVAYRSAAFPQDLRRIEAFVSFALMFILASLSVMPPLMMLGMPPLDALFESVSGITSTGLSLAANTESWPVAAHLLRGWMQWCGGFAIAFAGLAIFSGGSGASLSMGSSTITERDDKTSVRAQARQLLISYAGLTMLSVLLCLLLLPTWWEAVSVALSAVSTGGFTPRTDSLGSYSPLAQATVIGICVAAAVSLMFYIQIMRDGLSAALRKSHVAATLGLMLCGVLCFCAVDFAVNRPSLQEAFRGVLNFLSGFTTAGFSTNEVSSHVSLLPLILLAMLIGGDIGSTAGGIKVSRLSVLVQMVRLSVVRVRVPPSALTYLRDAGSKVEADRVIAVTSLLMLYMGALIVFWIIFLASGIDPLPGLFEVVSALSTVGLSQGVAAPDLAENLKLVLLLAMLLGRLEFVALIVLCLPSTWLKRS